MSLTPEQGRELIRQIGATRAEAGLACGACLKELAAFVETQLTGKPLTVIQERVEQHLAECVDCREEYQALRAAVESIEDAE